jgi:mannose-6-phosphate isomerase-like protein (cupin superfamily)
MTYVNLADRRRFDEEKMQKVPVFESEKMFFDQYCLLPGQSQRVHVHDDADKVYVVLEGEGMFEIGGERELLAEGMAAFAPAGVPHGVRNDSLGKLILLVAMAPKPKA